MSDGDWKLTPEQLESVERGHREFMKIDSNSVTPIRISSMPIDQTKTTAKADPRKDDGAADVDG